MRYFLRLAYNGTPYHGWQSQPNACGVQQVIEEALTTITRIPTPIVGAGRTDAGVHARTMYAHFDTQDEIRDCRKMTISLNRLCGRDIAIQDIIPVRDDAHARFDATRRTYKYFVTFSKTPFGYPLSWHCPSRLDVDKMNEAAKILLTTDDFTSFAKLHSDAKTNICDVDEAFWSPLSNADPAASLLGGDGIVFTISANRFLRNMVRAVVGTLVDVGRGKLTASDLRRIIADKDRCSAGTSMPAQALFLWDVQYPENIFMR